MLLSWLVAVALAEPAMPYQDLDCDGIPNPIDWRTTPPTPLPPSYTGAVEQDNAGDACVKWPETRRLRPDGTSTCSSDEVVLVSCGPMADTADVRGDTAFPPGVGFAKRFLLDPEVADADSDGLGWFQLPADCRAVPGHGSAGTCDPCPYDATIPYPNGDVVRDDADMDGVPDACDACPAVLGPVVPSDADHDGLDDLCDGCPTVADPLGLDGDADGTPDACDDCPDDAGAQGDADLDGVGDACDDCDRTLQGQSPGTDADADGFEDGCDVCPQVPNADQADAEFDGVGDLCDDCPFAPDPFQPDRDGDGVGDGCDVCPEVSDPDQADADADLIGDACAPKPGCGCATGAPGAGWWVAWTLAAAALRRRNAAIPEAAAR